MAGQRSIASIHGWPFPRAPRDAARASTQTEGDGLTCPLRVPTFERNRQTDFSAYVTPTIPTHALYRWQLPDPIYFAENLRVTLQQIGEVGGLSERSDDISTTAYWYELEPTQSRSLLSAVAKRRPR